MSQQPSNGGETGPRPGEGSPDQGEGYEYEDPGQDVPDLPDVWGVRGIGGFFEEFSYVTAFAGTLIILAITLLISANVISRRFLGGSIAGTIELVEYSLVWLTFLGAAWILRIDGHVKVDVLIMLLPRTPRKIFWWVSNLLGLTICVVLTYYSGMASYGAYETGRLLIKRLVLPYWAVTAVIPVGFAMLSIEYVLILIRGPRDSFLTRTLFS